MDYMKLQYHPNVFFTALHQLPPPIATSLDLAESDARPSPWDALYSLAADAGKSDLCGRMERGGRFSL